MSAQDLTSKVAIFAVNATKSDVIFVGNSRVPRVRPDKWSPGNMTFNVGPVQDSLGVLQDGELGTDYAVIPTATKEAALPAKASIAIGPWVQLLSAVCQTSGANVLVTMDPR